MLKAKDFRRYAREALKGRWLKAMGVSFIAGLLGASIGISSPGNFQFNFDNGVAEGNVNVSELPGVAESAAEISAVIMVIFLGVALVAAIWAIVMLVLGGATTLGYAKYNLNMADDNDPKLPDLLSQFGRLGTGFGMQFFRMLFTFLWSLLLVIPGIIASYAYYMTPFILCENPDMTAREAIRESKNLMKGNKWRLFCLMFSFFGWILLAMAIIWFMLMFLISGIVFAGPSVLNAVSAGVIIVIFMIVFFVLVAAILVLTPYINVATAVFYREITENKYSNPQVEADAEEMIMEDISIE